MHLGRIRPHHPEIAGLGTHQIGEKRFGGAEQLLHFAQGSRLRVGELGVLRELAGENSAQFRQPLVGICQLGAKTLLPLGIALIG